MASEITHRRDPEDARMAVKAQDIIDECRFSGPGPFDGMYFADFFTLSPHAEFATRSEAIEAMRAAYKGDDSDGVGVVLPEVA